ncbi:hypothetical protein FRC01_000376 [Tulasnella sp. 417]|nr:hypothetical protein FRC01_000376 [Tulasnella sp. 417]
MIGLDTANRSYAVSGVPTNKFSVTSIAEIGTAAFLSGDERGEVIDVNSTSAAETKQKLLDNPADLLSLVKYVDSLRNRLVRLGLPAPLSKYMLGSGVTDFSKENENNLVNPGQSLWIWKTVTEASKGNKGVHPPLSTI